MPLRVCLVSVQYIGTITGGGGVHVVNLSRELAKIGVDITVVSMGIKNLPDHEIISINGAKIKVRRFFTQDSNFIDNPFEGTKQDEIRRLDEFCQKALDFLLNENFDVIHLHGHFMVPGLAKSLKENNCKAKIVTTFHAFESLIELIKGEYMANKEIFEYIKQKEKDALEFSDAVIIASKHLVKDLRKVHGNLIDKVNIKIIPNGVEDYLFKQEKNLQAIEKIRNELKCDHMLFNLNRLDPSKKIEYVLLALPLVSKNISGSLALFIAGKLEKRNVKYKQYLEKLAYELMQRYSNIKVRILENISEDEKILLYDAADAYIMSSPSEPFGITILEALARGTPVIIPDAPGPKEIFNLEKPLNAPFIEIPFGLIVNFSNEKNRLQNLARAIVYFLENKDYFKRNSEDMRNFVKQRYSWSAVARKVLEVYNELLKEQE